MSYPSRDMQHITLTPKWRKPKFEREDITATCDRLIRHICAFHGIEIMALAIQPDHIHLMVIIPLRLSVAYCVQQIKWFSSVHLRRIYPELKEDKYLWAKHYFQVSVGGGRAAQLRYIEKQIRGR